MERADFDKYLDKRVFMILKSGFKYKVILTYDCIKETSLSFLDKFNNPVDVDFDDIAFITISNDGGYN